MIDRVRFENFKSLKDVTLELDRLTVLVGHNGCGKSSVLQGLYLPSQAGRLAAQDEALQSVLRGRTASAVEDQPIEIHLHERDGSELSFGLADSEQGPATEIEVDGEQYSNALLTPTITAMILRNKVQRLTSAAYLTLDPSKMVKASVPDAGTPEMQVDGGGLASVLAWMKGAAEDEIALVTKDLCRVVPGVKRIRTFRQEIARRKHQKLDVDGQPVWRSVDEKVLGDRFELEFDDGHSVPADLLSEGTVLALGLLTKLREPTRPRMILLDDIDRGLHIEAQAKLVTVLRELLEEIPELQIVCTTHSPYLLDRFKPEEVRLLALDEKRHTKALTLTEHPEYEKWKFGTQTGELWAALGDGWVKTSGASQ